MWNNWQYRALALVMALFCWYVVSGQEKVESWLEVPLEFVNLPAPMEITAGMVNKIQVRIRGTSNQVRSLNTGRLAYKLDLGTIQTGSNIIPLIPERMNVTSAVEIVEIRPASLELMADATITQEIPVHLEWQGLPAPDTQIKTISLEPSKILVKGLASNFQGLEQVHTEQVDIVSNDELKVSGLVPVLLPQGLRSETSSVRYQLDFALKTQEIWVKMNLETISYPTFRYSIEPKFVRAKLAMPVRLLKDKDWRESLSLVLDPGQRPEEEFKLIQPEPRFPDGVQILELRPEEVEVRFFDLENNHE